MKKYLIIICIAVLGNGLFAQQDSHYSQYMFNHLAINPAYAGSAGYISSTLIYRKQWVNVEGAPTTQSFAVHGPSNNLRHGFGLAFYNDEIGVTRTSTLNLAYSYRIPLNDIATLSFGLHGTVENISNRLSGVRTTSLISSSSQDPAFANNLNLWRPNAGAGVFFNTNHFYLGLSAPDLIENSVNGTNEVLGVDDQARERRHFFVHTGFITGTDESPFRFKPSFLLKYVPGAPINFDVNAQFWIQNRVWLGASYRLEDAVVGMLGIQLTNWLNVGYAYDYTISELSNVSNGSHEIMLGIDLNFKRMGMVSPRWF